MQGPCIIAFRSNLRPQFFVRISPLVPEPKMLPRSLKPSGPHILRRRLKLNPSPVYYGMAPHARSTPTNPTAAHIISFLQEDEGEADL